jgi:WD40 repeat protein
VWDNFRAPTTVLTPEMGVIKDCCWSPDGKRVLTASSDGNVNIWDVAKSECSATWRASDGASHATTASQIDSGMGRARTTRAPLLSYSSHHPNSHTSVYRPH